VSGKLKLSLGILCALIALAALGFLAPRAWHAERSVIISAAPEKIHPYVNTPRKWREWATAPDPDRTIRYTYQGPEQGPGAAQTWKGDRDYGFMKILKSDPRKGVWFESAHRSEEVNNRGSFTYRKTGEGTRVTWSGEGELPPFVGIFLKTIEDGVGDYYDYALVHLENLVESGTGAE
jgi:hypothetical protein